MSDPPPNAFIGRTNKPTDADLTQSLSSVKPVWDSLIAEVEALGATTPEWKSYSPKGGWSLRLLRKKRTIVWLSPCEGCFQVLFILGDKALTAARQSDLSAKGVQALAEAKKYPEGTGVRLLVKSSKDIPLIRKLAVAKLEN